MGKFPFKRPRIISKNFPEIDSHVDRVSKSLEGLVFSYSKHVDKTLQKKHLMMAASSLTLLIVLGSFVSPKGRADISTFYPDTCLGGWINPENAEGEPQTTSNGDKDQFTQSNSAILPKNTNADIYCGNFVGKFDEATRPKKILVSLALTEGADVSLETMITNDSFASSSLDILDTTSTTDVSFTLTASSTTEVASSSPSLQMSSTTSSSTKEVSQSIATSSVPTPITEEVSSVIDSIVTFIGETVSNLFTTTNPAVETDTVIIPPPAPEPQPESQAPEPEPVPQPESQAPEPESAPTSFRDRFLQKISNMFIQTVSAQEEAPQTPEALLEENSTPQEPTPQVVEETSISASPEPSPETSSSASSTEEKPEQGGITVGDLATTSIDTLLDASLATTTVGTSTVATTTDTNIDIILEDENQFQNNFLEVFYTFDGTTWESLGELNKISMKYKNFEIPVTASTSWGSIKKLQVKVVSKKNIDDTPTVYLDAIKFEVLYETITPHEHPDFGRDVIVEDKSADGVRVVDIVNNDTGTRQLWYTTIDTQGEYGIAPGTWVKTEIDETNTDYTFIDIYGQNIFWLDDSKKMLWVTNLQRATNNGIELALGTNTITSFIKANGEEWVFEYNSTTTTGVMRYKN